MKRAFYLLLLAGFISTAQNQTSVKFVPYFSSINLKPTSFQVNLTNKKNSFNYDTFNVYNPNYNLNDNYYKMGNGYEMSTTKSFSMSNFNGSKIDSFNPNGTRDLGGALVFGALNLLLNKF